MNLVQLGVLSALVLASHDTGCSSSEWTPKPRRFHERLLTLDTHLDTPAHLVWKDWSILDRHRVDDDGSQIGLPRMIDGGLDSGFFAVYTPQGPVTPKVTSPPVMPGYFARLLFASWWRAHPDRFELALKADDAAAIAARGNACRVHEHRERLPLRGGSVAHGDVLQAGRSAP